MRRKSFLINHHPMILLIGHKKVAAIEINVRRFSQSLRSCAAALVDRIRDKIGLANYSVGVGVIGRRELVVNQNSMVIGVGDENSRAIRRHAMRLTERVGSNAATLIAAVRSQVGLINYKISGGTISCWKTIIDEHAVVVAISN